MRADVTVAGWHEGARVAGGVLPHGVDPEALLASSGWRVERVREVTGRLGADLTVHVDVAPGPEVPLAPRPPEVVAGVALGDVEPVLRQRVAAYAVVSSARGWLLTELSGSTSRPGWWTLPGGGIDDGETVTEAIHREVWEETGQRVRLGPLLAVVTGRWLGPGSAGVLEDYHAVRFVHRATCEVPVDPVVHDAGGSTASARWFAGHELGQVPVVRTWARVLPAVTGATATFG